MPMRENQFQALVIGALEVKLHYRRAGRDGVIDAAEQATGLQLLTDLLGRASRVADAMQFALGVMQAGEPSERAVRSCPELAAEWNTRRREPPDAA